MKNISKIANQLTGQKMFQIMDKSRTIEDSGREVIHLEIGDPDFASPPRVIEACKDALDSGMTHYVSSYGLEELRLAGAESTLKSRGYKPDIRQIVITAGANVQIYYVVACTVNPGDEVIITDPAFVTYEEIIKLVGGIPVKVPLREENNFRLDPLDLEKAITKNTRLIITNSPHNPTGAVIQEDTYKEIYNICEKYDIYLLSDEVYGRMVYEKSGMQFFSPSTFDQCKERVIVAHSLSKSFSMTGWRIGAVTAPIDLANKIALLLETTSSCVSPFIQKAAISALLETKDYVDQMMIHYRNRRDLLVKGLNQVEGMSCQLPDGAFYAFANIKKTGLTSIEFSDVLLEKYGIATCPGIYFGDAGEGYVRFCFAQSEEKIKIACDRMLNFTVT
jgi:aspartate/methionine/tyrosine aminotransferase